MTETEGVGVCGGGPREVGDVVRQVLGRREAGLRARRAQRRRARVEAASCATGGKCVVGFARGGVHMVDALLSRLNRRLRKTRIDPGARLGRGL